MIDTTTRDVISVWMGTSNKPMDEFNQYTEGMESPNSGCPAHKDFGVHFIDSDFFGYYMTQDNKIIPIEELVNEVGTSSRKTDQEIIKKAKGMGVTEGNSLYYYVGATFHEEEPGKLYNDLRFIGTFSDPWKKYR